MAATATAASNTPQDTSALVSLDEIRAAARVLHGVAVRTPLLPADDLSARLGGGAIFVKPEMLQRGGAFKFRGAYTFLAALTSEERARGVIAPSSGNHAQAVAFAARIFGVQATLVMPTTVTAVKRAGVERLGGRVELAGRTHCGSHGARGTARERERECARATLRRCAYHCGAGHGRTRDRGGPARCRHRARAGWRRRVERRCGHGRQARWCPARA